MENNFSYTHSYAESGDSSPRSREIDFENSNSSWDTNNIDHPNYKVKFMCSYGGKILPRPHDNQLAYIGGETKILAVDRSVKLPQLLSKLSNITDFDPTEISFKYQLPGEDLDALISVTTDDDLEHMMQEYDRIVRTSAKPARLRLFMFVVTNSTPNSFGMNDSKSDKDRFVEALNTGPAAVVAQAQQSAPPPPPNKVDFLFGLENKVRDHQTPVVENDFVDLKKLRIDDEYVRKNDDNISYLQNKPEKMQALFQQHNMQIPASYWPPEKQIPVTGVYPVSTMSSDHQQQQVYMISSPAPPANMYHAPMGTPVTGPTGQGYYAMQRMQPEVYREQVQQPVYNVVTQAMPQPTQVVPKTTSFPVTSGVMDGGYGQVAYDSAGGRQVFYTAPGGVVSQPVAVPPYQPMAAYGGDMRAVAANFNQEGGGKVVQVKVSQASG